MSLLARRALVIAVLSGIFVSSDESKRAASAMVKRKSKEREL